MLETNSVLACGRKLGIRDINNFNGWLTIYRTQNGQLTWSNKKRVFLYLFNEKFGKNREVNNWAKACNRLTTHTSQYKLAIWFHKKKKFWQFLSPSQPKQKLPSIDPKQIQQFYHRQLQRCPQCTTHQHIGLELEDTELLISYVKQ